MVALPYSPEDGRELGYDFTVYTGNDSIDGGDVGDDGMWTAPTAEQLAGHIWTWQGTLAEQPAMATMSPVSYTHLLIGNKYGTANHVPFRVVDQRAGIDIDVGIRCFGEYSYHICNPALFYTNVCGNVAEAYTRDKLDSQLKTELLTALQPAFAKIGENGIRYSQLPGHTMAVSYTHLDVYKRQVEGSSAKHG